MFDIIAFYFNILHYNFYLVCLFRAALCGFFIRTHPNVLFHCVWLWFMQSGAHFLVPKTVCSEMLERHTCGLYYKPMTIVNDDSRVINKLEASLTYATRVVIYDRHMCIVQTTGGQWFKP